MKNTNKNTILKMYYKNKMKPVDIAKELNISKSAVSQHLQKSRKYRKEKERRKQRNAYINNERKIEKQRELRKQKRLEKNQDNLILKNIHKTASIELSDSRRLSNIAYLKWNRSSYTYNIEKNRFDFRKELESKRSYAVPKYIKGNYNNGKKI